MEIRYTNKMEGQLTDYQRSLEKIIEGFPFTYVDQLHISHPYNLGWDSGYIFFVGYMKVTLVVTDRKNCKGYFVYLDRMKVHQDNAEMVGLQYLMTIGEFAHLVELLQEQHLLLDDNEENK